MENMHTDFKVYRVNDWKAESNPYTLVAVLSLSADNQIQEAD